MENVDGSQEYLVLTDTVVQVVYRPVLRWLAIITLTLNRLTFVIRIMQQIQSSVESSLLLLDTHCGGQLLSLCHPQEPCGEVIWARIPSLQSTVIAILLVMTVSHMGSSHGPRANAQRTKVQPGSCLQPLGRPLTRNALLCSFCITNTCTLK